MVEELQKWKIGVSDEDEGISIWDVAKNAGGPYALNSQETLYLHIPVNIRGRPTTAASP